MCFIKRGKQGQFYLIAAVIIIGIIVGVTGLTNYIIKKNIQTKVYDFSDELSLEGEKVVNYGIYQQEDLDLLLDNFTEEYAYYASSPNLEIFFVYGNENEFAVASLARGTTGEISLIFGNSNPVTLQVSGTQVTRERFSLIDPDKKVKVLISGVDYEFKLKKGENFYFIIQQEIEGEKHVTQ